MTFAATGFQTIGVMGTPDGSAGSRRQLHTFITTDSPATVETADYFLSIYKKLKANDLLLVSYKNAVNRARTYVLDAVSSSSVTIRREEDDDAIGQGARAVVPTADGTTTGLILDSDSMVVATSANANHILKLPACTAATRGREINIWVVPSTNCELQTTGAGCTINNVDCSGGAVEALLTHTQLYVARQHLDNGWLLQAFTALGAVATAIVPD